MTQAETETLRKTLESQAVLFTFCWYASAVQLRGAIEAAAKQGLARIAEAKGSAPAVDTTAHVSILYKKDGARRGQARVFCPDRRLANILMNLDCDGTELRRAAKAAPAELDMSDPESWVPSKTSWADILDEEESATEPVRELYTPIVIRCEADGKATEDTILFRRCLSTSRSELHRQGVSHNVLSGPVPAGVTLPQLKHLLGRFTTSPGFPQFEMRAGPGGATLVATFDPEKDDGIAAQEMLLFYQTTHEDLPGAASLPVLRFFLATAQDDPARRAVSGRRNSPNRRPQQQPGRARTAPAHPQFNLAAARPNDQARR